MESKGTAAVVGAGLIGRLLAWQLVQNGWRVTLFDRDEKTGTASCAWSGAGMLTPIAELEKSEARLAKWGLRALQMWPRYLASLNRGVFYQQAGSLVVAHRQEWAELEAFGERVSRSLVGEPRYRRLDDAGITRLEPQLAGRFSRAIFLPDEGQLEPRDLLPALAESLQEKEVEWHAGVAVHDLEPGRVTASTGSFRFDWVVDTRGLGAKPDWHPLRGVRGELIRLHAPEVTLHRPVRLMHPRYPLYLVPRPNQVYLVGATSIESEDQSGISVRSTLELLSAAYSLHTGFAEARILETVVGCRPALPNHLPCLRWQPGYLAVNGLYRHGFLLAPVLVEVALAILQGRTPPPELSDVPMTKIAS